MFLWRHRNKVLFVCAAGAAAYVGGRYLAGKAVELREREKADQHESRKLQEHNESNRQTAMTTVLSLVPTLKEAIYELLNTEAITSQLQNNPTNKLALWENLKILSFARVVVSVYATAMMTAFVRVQLSVLGGRMVLDQQKSPGQLPAPMETQKQYLSTVQYLLKEGLVDLERAVLRASETVLVELSLKHKLTCQEVLQVVTDIRNQTPPATPTTSSSSSSSSSSSHLAPPPSSLQYGFLVQHMLPKEPLVQPDTAQASGDLAQSNLLLAATRDILEGLEFRQVLDACVNSAFLHTSRNITESFHSAAQSSSTLPLARVIPIVADHSLVVLDAKHHRTTVTELVGMADLQRLCENVYEAFTEP